MRAYLRVYEMMRLRVETMMPITIVSPLVQITIVPKMKVNEGCGCACIREDADHDRVADGAGHDGADEGADARSVDADRVGGRLVVNSDDVLRCVRCGIALR